MLTGDFRCLKSWLKKKQTFNIVIFHKINIVVCNLITQSDLIVQRMPPGR